MAFLDGSFAPAKNGGEKVGLTKKGKGTKWMLVVDGNGLPLGFHLDSASRAEVRLAQQTLEMIRVARPRGRPKQWRPKRGRPVLARRAQAQRGISGGGCGRSAHLCRVSDLEVRHLCREPPIYATGPPMLASAKSRRQPIAQVVSTRRLHRVEIRQAIRPERLLIGFRDDCALAHRKRALQVDRTEHTDNLHVAPRIIF